MRPITQGSQCPSRSRPSHQHYPVHGDGFIAEREKAPLEPVDAKSGIVVRAESLSRQATEDRHHRWDSAILLDSLVALQCTLRDYIHGYGRGPDPKRPARI